MRRITRSLLTTLAASLVAGTVSMVTPQAAVAETSGSLQYYGVQLHSLWSENRTADVTRQLDLLAGANANSARVDVAWSSLQTDGRGTINSSYRARIDELVAGAEARGIKLILTLIETPCWASAAPESLKLGCSGAYWDRNVTKHAPADVADFAWVANWVAARYGARIAALELWNEPNYDEGGYSPLITADHAATYAAMVKAAYPAAKAAAPDLPVLAGSMSFADDVFLEQLYAHGMKGSYDGISVHPYNEWRAPGAPHDPTWYKYDYVLGLNAIRRAMVAAGDTTPVWVTELGWTSCTIGANKWCVTEQQQAEYVAAAVRLATTWPWVKALIIYNLKNRGSDPLETEYNFGLVRRDYSPKPALASLGRAFAAVSATPAPVQAVAPTAPVAPVDPAEPIAPAEPLDLTGTLTGGASGGIAEAVPQAEPAPAPTTAPEPAAFIGPVAPAPALIGPVAPTRVPVLGPWKKRVRAVR